MRCIKWNGPTVRSLSLALTLGVALSACARGQPSGPEARLGKPTYDQGRTGYGRDQRYGVDSSFGRAGSGMPGSIQQFQTAGADTVYFSSDNIELSTESKHTLSQQARWLNQYRSHTILIEGHADERGTREYNIALGAKRAAVVKNFLVSQSIDPARLRTLSYGKERPVASCNDISCWSQNRRAQTVLGATAISRN